MPGHLQKNILLVVSDTAMMYDGNKLLAFDPVLREMKVVEEMFDKIIWLGARTLKMKPSLKPVSSAKVHPVVMPCVSHSGFINILYVLSAYPVFLYQILKHLKYATHVHTRGPSHPALLMILISLLDNKRIYAHKYAGEWTDDNIPFTYRLQRNLLKKVRKPNIRITVSGKNDTDSENVYDLENPCMYEDELRGMNATGAEKDFSGKLRLLFVGNLMPSKGIIPLMQALQSSKLSDRYESIHIVGGGML
ncbi:MAG: glycosyltransferase, partial [Chitinophagaceae bacterium]|nr:glycosyltransferase [Chitinophagaceae bacterium]